MPLAERMTFGSRSALIIRDSSLVTLTRRPGNWMGSMPFASNARVSVVKAVRVGILEDAGRLDGKGTVDVHREVAVARDKPLFSLISRMK